MPVVPFTKGRSVPAGLGQNAASPTAPPLDWGLMAAAQMHSEGRLIQISSGKAPSIDKTKTVPDSTPFDLRTQDHIEESNQRTESVKEIKDFDEMSKAVRGRYVPER